MATTSTIPAVCTAIVTAVTAALPGVQVTDGKPPDSLLARESIFIGDISGTHDIPVMKAGRKQRQEEYEVEVWVWVAKARGTIADTKARAHVLWAALENTLANDPSLTNLDGVLWARMGSFEEQSIYDAEGPRTAFRSNVTVAARLV